MSPSHLYIILIVEGPYNIRAVRTLPVPLSASNIGPQLLGIPELYIIHTLNNPGSDRDSHMIFSVPRLGSETQAEWEAIFQISN